MASVYPGNFDTVNTFGTPVGTSDQSSPDHAQAHVDLGSAVTALEAVVGSTSGTNILKTFAAGNFPVRINSSNVLQQRVSGTVDTAVLGTPVISAGTYTGGTINAAVMGSPIITGGMLNSFVFGTPIGTGGTWNGAVFGTPTIGTITVPGTTIPLQPSAALAPSNGTIVDSASGTLTVNAQASNVWYCVMGTNAGNRTIGTPLNPTAFQQLTYGFKASGSSNGTLVWSGVFVFSQNIGTPTLGTGVAWNYYGWRYNSIDSKWHYMGQSVNVI